MMKVYSCCVVYFFPSKGTFGKWPAHNTDPYPTPPLGGNSEQKYGHDGGVLLVGKNKRKLIPLGEKIFKLCRELQSADYCRA